MFSLRGSEYSRYFQNAVQYSWCLVKNIFSIFWSITPMASFDINLFPPEDAFELFFNSNVGTVHSQISEYERFKFHCSLIEQKKMHRQCSVSNG